MCINNIDNLVLGSYALPFVEYLLLTNTVSLCSDGIFGIGVLKIFIQQFKM